MRMKDMPKTMNGWKRWHYEMQTTKLIKNGTELPEPGIKSNDGKTLYVGTPGGTLVRANKSATEGMTKKQRRAFRADAKNRATDVSVDALSVSENLKKGSTMDPKNQFVTVEDVIIPKGTVLTKDEGAETLSATVGNAKVTYDPLNADDMINVTEQPIPAQAEAAAGSAGAQS